MSTLDNRPNTALLVIDVQNGVVGEAHDRDAVVANVATLVDKARAADIDVVWVQHNGDDLPRDSEQWQYVPELERTTPSRWCTSRTATPSRTPTSRRCSPSTGSAGSSSPARRPTSASARPSTARSSGATTRPWSATPTPPRTSREYGAPTPDQVIAHTNLYWKYHRAPGRTAGTVTTDDVDFAGGGTG